MCCSKSYDGTSYKDLNTHGSKTLSALKKQTEEKCVINPTWRRYSVMTAPLLMGQSHFSRPVDILMTSATGAEGWSGAPGPDTTSKASDQGPAPARLTARTFIGR